ncbi:MAG TPA: aquaporin [Chloroflexia bacterium]|nr:aquaporin [Chloroflexia bacterium]
MTVTLAIGREDWQKVLAELIGTFFFLLFGIGAIPAALLTGSADSPAALNTGFLYIALAHGLALAVAISALGHISGGHFNPAVTAGMLVAGRITPLLALLYLLAQLIGGIGSCLAIVYLLPRNVWEQFGLGTPDLAASATGQGIFLEAILTFFLVLVVFGTAVDRRAAALGGFAIGLAMTLGIMIAGPLGLGLMNPARAFAPAVVAGLWGSSQLVFWVGPLIGGIAAGLLYNFIFLKDSDGMMSDEELVEAEMVGGHAANPPLSEPNLVDESALVHTARAADMADTIDTSDTADTTAGPEPRR